MTVSTGTKQKPKPFVQKNERNVFYWKIGMSCSDLN